MTYITMAVLGKVHTSGPPSVGSTSITHVVIERYLSIIICGGGQSAGSGVTNYGDKLMLKYMNCLAPERGGGGKVKVLEQD